MRMNFLKRNLNWVCHHTHLDKSNIISRDLLDQSQKHMKAKWHIMDDIKKKYTKQRQTKKTFSKEPQQKQSIRGISKNN